jgi:hypothetical protein
MVRWNSAVTEERGGWEKQGRRAVTCWCVLTDTLTLVTPTPPKASTLAVVVVNSRLGRSLQVPVVIDAHRSHKTRRHREIQALHKEEYAEATTAEVDRSCRGDLCEQSPLICLQRLVQRDRGRHGGTGRCDGCRHGRPRRGDECRLSGQRFGGDGHTSDCTAVVGGTATRGTATATRGAATPTRTATATGTGTPATTSTP